MFLVNILRGLANGFMSFVHIVTRPWNGVYRCNYPKKRPRKRKCSKRRSPRKK
jgi:hypothetical protein